MNELHGPRLKLSRAKHHLSDINNRMEQYISLKPCTFRIDPHPEPPDYAVRGYVNRPVPQEIGLVIGDCAHNARSALDLLVYALSNLPADDKRREGLQFPIVVKPSDFQAQVSRGKLCEVPERFVKIIESCQPYEGRSQNQPILFINDLNNRDKHRLITATGAIARNTRLVIETQAIPQVKGKIIISGSARFSSDQFDIQFVNNGEITEDGAVVAKLRHTNGDFKMNPESAIDVHFAKGSGRVEHRNVSLTLSLILDHLEEVFGKFEQPTH